MKKQRRKLRLNRETIRNLDANHLHNVAGGVWTDQPDCDTGGPETGDVTACNDTGTTDGTGGTIGTVGVTITDTLFTATATC